VGAEEIAEVVSRATGIPVSKMMQGERDKLLHMEARIHERGGRQDERCAWSPTRSGARAPGCPIRTGPTAVSCSSADRRRQDRAVQALAAFLFDPRST